MPHHKTQLTQQGCRQPITRHMQRKAACRKGSKAEMSQEGIDAHLAPSWQSQGCRPLTAAAQGKCMVVRGKAWAAAHHRAPSQ